jgi:hypothetical protein
VLQIIDIILFTEIKLGCLLSLQKLKIQLTISVNTLLFIKLALMPFLIASVTLCVRRWGAGIGGWVGGFPWVAGPISFFMAWEQGAPFVANTIPSALMGSVGTVLFAFVYARLSARWHWFPTVMVSYSVFFVIAYFTFMFTPSLLEAGIVNALVLTVTLYFFPKPRQSAAPPRQPRYDIPLRMLVATVFVLVLTQAADSLGPQWSGILTPFPIMTSTLAVFTHAQQGPAATARILYGLLLAGYGFVAFLLGVHWIVPLLPIGWAYLTLTLGTLTLNGVTLRLIR